MSMQARPVAKPHIPDSVRRACEEAVQVALSALPPKHSSLITDETVRWIIDHLSKSNIVDQIDEWRNEAKTKSGAPSKVSTHAFLVGLLVTARDRGIATMAEVTTTLYRRISPEMRRELGLADLTPSDDRTVTARRFRAAYRNVRYARDSILAVMDPSPLPKDRMITKVALAEAERRMHQQFTAEGLLERRNRIDWVANSLLELSFNVLPREIRRKWKGSVAIDATPVAAYAQGTKKRSDWASTDPDAGWYIRQGNHDPEQVPEEGDRGRLRNKGFNKIMWGYEATLAIMGADDPADEHLFPYLVLAMTMHRPGLEPGKNAMRLLQSLDERGHQKHFCGGDRAYFPNADPEDLQIPARERGYRFVNDYQSDQLGVQEPTTNGMILVEGAWYCPSMPADLIYATHDYRFGDRKFGKRKKADSEKSKKPSQESKSKPTKRKKKANKPPPFKIDLETYVQRIEARRNYLVRLKDGNGENDRWYCPASGSKPLAICDRKPVSFRTADGKPRIFSIINGESLNKELKTMVELPKLCQQGSAPLAKTAGAKWLQDLLFGSDEWHAVYSTLRNTIEGANGVLKNGCHEGLADSRRRPTRGLAAATLFSAVLIWAANLRRIHNFLAEAVPSVDHDTPVRKRRKPKPRTSWEEGRRRAVRRPQDPPPPPPAEMVFT